MYCTVLYVAANIRGNAVKTVKLPVLTRSLVQKRRRKQCRRGAEREGGGGIGRDGAGGGGGGRAWFWAGTVAADLAGYNTAGKSNSNICYIRLPHITDTPRTAI